MIVNYQKIYEKLGYLFYALASADKHLQKKELSILRRDIEKEWIPLENSTDEFGTDAANYIYFTFDSLADQDASPIEAFEMFRNYFLEHENAFNSDIRKRIQKTLSDMASGFSHHNKTEQYILAETKKLLNRKKSLAKA